jgi:hypothetical protein
MINIETGNLIIDSIPGTIGPSMSRSEFLASTLALKATIVLANEQYHIYSIGALPISGFSFFIALQFYGDILDHISLSYKSSPAEASSWNDWSLDQELQKKDIHDRWLTRTLDSEIREFQWGRITSVYDDRIGASSIHISYLHLCPPISASVHIGPYQPLR